MHFLYPFGGRVHETQKPGPGLVTPPGFLDDEPFELTHPFDVSTDPPERPERPNSTTPDECGCTDTSVIIICLPAIIDYIIGFIGYVLALSVRPVYISIFHLHIPEIYFKRVAKVFEDAKLSKRDVQQVLKGVDLDDTTALNRFTESWESFVDTLLREWKMLNLVSTLLLTAILTLIQMQGIKNDPVSRITSLFSLLSSR
ncbi:hypothetical protein APHAL10511_003226 [Amanita phalloides]|nr:hypothetical protein APHAL10511_003226 [Amanita phalloides]